MTIKWCPGALARVPQKTAWMTLLAVTACESPYTLAEDSECSLDGPTFTFLSCNLNRGPLPTGNGWVGTGS